MKNQDIERQEALHEKALRILRNIRVIERQIEGVVETLEGAGAAYFPAIRGRCIHRLAIKRAARRRWIARYENVLNEVRATIICTPTKISHSYEYD